MSFLIHHNPNSLGWDNASGFQTHFSQQTALRDFQTGKYN